MLFHRPKILQFFQFLYRAGLHQAVDFGAVVGFFGAAGCLEVEGLVGVLFRLPLLPLNLEQMGQLLVQIVLQNRKRKRIIVTQLVVLLKRRNPVLPFPKTPKVQCNSPGLQRRLEAIEYVRGLFHYENVLLVFEKYSYLTAHEHEEFLRAQYRSALCLGYRTVRDRIRT